MLAKQEYAAELATPGVYDQKSSMGLTYYGLPFFTVGAGGGEGPAVLPQTPPAGTTVRSSDFTVDPDFVQRDVGSGTYWTVGSELPQATHDRPLQPRTVRDVTATDGLPVHGAVVEFAHGAGPSTASTACTPIRRSTSPACRAPRCRRTATARSSRAGCCAPPAAPPPTACAISSSSSPASTPRTGRQQSLYTHIGGQVLRSNSTDYEPAGDHVDRCAAGVGLDRLEQRIDGDVLGEDELPDVTRAIVLYRKGWEGTWNKLELTRVGTSSTWKGDAGSGCSTTPRVRRAARRQRRQRRRVDQQGRAVQHP